jgi:adenine deaminase
MLGRMTKNTRRLVDCAMGRLPADLVVRGGKWVCVQSGEVLPDTDLAIIDGWFAYVGPNANHCIGEHTRVVEAKGRYLVPGLLDGHVHIESGMITVTEFVRAVIPHGTTGLFVDPHEIANIFGLRGVRLMVDESYLQPIHVFVQMPSCVPSAPGFETPGAVIGPTEVAEAMTWPGIIGLGEMMDFPGVYNSDEKVHAEMAVTRQSDKVIGGHYASPDLGLPFHGYVAGGPQDDHEGTRVEDAVERTRQGMYVMMRYGSAWQDVAAQVKAITELGLDPRHFMLCTDDAHCATLVEEGHMDRVIRHAIAEGLEPLLAIQMATLTTAEYFGVSREMGMIAPGRHADFLLVGDLNQFDVQSVYGKGELLAEDGKILFPVPKVSYPDWVTCSVNLLRPMQAADFYLETNRHGRVTLNVIGVIENQAPTRHLRLEIEIEDGEISPDPAQDLAKVAVVERHHNSGRVQVGLVKGFGFIGHCAAATTVAHDSHQIIVVGTHEEDMALAVNELNRISGGQVVVKDGQVIGSVDLPIAGLMSSEPAEIVSEKAASVLAGFKACGCNINNSNMQLSLLGLVVIPELRISDLGLVDVNKFQFISVIE